jgi:hypothetical protein
MADRGENSPLQTVDIPVHSLSFSPVQIYICFCKEYYGGNFIKGEEQDKPSELPWRMKRSM